MSGIVPFDVRRQKKSWMSQKYSRRAFDHAKPKTVRNKSIFLQNTSWNTWLNCPEQKNDIHKISSGEKAKVTTGALIIRHYGDVIMRAIAPQIAGGVPIVCPTVGSGVYQRNISKLRVTGLWVGNSPVELSMWAEWMSNFMMWLHINAAGIKINLFN